MHNHLQREASASWKQRFRAPFIGLTEIAPGNPTRGLATSNASGTMQLYAWDVPTAALRQLTHRPLGVAVGALAGDGRSVYYLDDTQGNELGHFVQIPFEGGAPRDLTPELPPYSSFTFGSSRSGSHFGFMAADSEGFHIYSVRTDAKGDIGTPHQLFHSRKIAFGLIYSSGGEVGIVATTDRATVQHCNLLAFDVASGVQFAELWDGPGTSVEPMGFSPRPGDWRLAGTTNRTGVKRPLVWNPRTSERTDLDLPDLAGEVFPLDWSWESDCLLLCQVAQAVQQLYVYDFTTQVLTRLDHPSGTYGAFGHVGTYFGPGHEIYASWQDAAHPSRLIAIDARTGRLTRTLLAAGEVPPGRAWKSISFRSSDGQMIQGWLGVPEGEGPFPTILHTHGGPEAVMMEVFGPGSQAWMDHGFAVLTINYRGSTTFGREFREKIWGDVGHWEMEDLAAARHWLVSEGIARPDAILLTGGSYGGYLTLLGLGKWPEFWAGGMALLAIADWTMNYEDSADTLKGYDVALFGGPPEEYPDRYRRSSPLTYAEHVKAPVVIIQGRNDSRTPGRSIEVYEQRLKALGKSVEVHWVEAGHLGAGVERTIQDFDIMLRFAFRVLNSGIT